MPSSRALQALVAVVETRASMARHVFFFTKNQATGLVRCELENTQEKKIACKEVVWETVVGIAAVWLVGVMSLELPAGSLQAIFIFRLKMLAATSACVPIGTASLARPAMITREVVAPASFIAK